MEIGLDLSRHCIKTEVKRQYNKMLSQYFKSGEKNFEDRIEFLKDVLQNVDLANLRSRFRDLAGDSDAEVKIFRKDDGLFQVKLNGQIVWQEYLPQEEV